MTIRLKPTAARYNNRGAAYYGLKQYQRAIQDFDKAIQLDPKYAAACQWRRNAYYNLGQHTKANADKSKACYLASKWC